MRPVFASDAPPPTGAVYEAENGILSGPTRIEEDPGGASGGKRVGALWEPNGSLTFNNVDGGSGGLTKVIITYSNGVDTPATTIMKVNGVTSSITLPPTRGWGGSRDDYVSVTTEISLNAGTTNTIAFGGQSDGNGGGWTCDKITVPPVGSATASTVAGNSAHNIVADYWPYLLLLVILGVTMVIVKKHSEAH